MHNYSVSNRFTTKTKLGNWYQQQQLDDHNFKQYLFQKQQNNNLTLNTTGKLSLSNAPMELTSRQERKGISALYSGDKIQLWNCGTQGVLAWNVNQNIMGEESYAVTTSRGSKSVVRNVVTVENGGNVGEEIRFGHKIRLTSTIRQQKLYLQSLPVNPMRSSKFSRLQQVSITAILSSHTLWTIEHPDPIKRADSVGNPIPQGLPLLFKHISTGQWLASDLVSYVNEFGAEYQVFCKSYLSTNKTQNLWAQKEGHRAVQNCMRRQDKRNQWRVIKG